MDADLDSGEALASSPLNETEALMEADEDLEEEEDNDGCTDTLLGGVAEEQEEEDGEGEESRTKSVDSIDGGGSVDETSKLLNNSGGDTHPNSGEGGGRSGRAGSSNSISGTGGGNVEPKSPREPFSYAYHFKKKYTFRSDSVYSDVTPMSSAPQNTAVSPKNPESRDKSGSLSSLKGSQSTSKWVSLKKKLGKLNTLSSGKSKSSAASPSSSQQQLDACDEPSALQQQAAAVAAAAAAAQGETSRTGKPSKSLQERRSLLQRAKTLSILPVNSAPKNKDAQPPKRITQPPELFNVGGEMNLIPLEMLIDINDIRRPQ